VFGGAWVSEWGCGCMCVRMVESGLYEGCVSRGGYVCSYTHLQLLKNDTISHAFSRLSCFSELLLC